MPDIHTPVRIRIEVNNGELLGLGSADPISEDPYDQNECTLYNGEALAVVRGNDDVIVRGVRTDR